MTTSTSIAADEYSHDLLLHEGLDEILLESTREFVRRGLEADGEVLVHGDEDRVAFLRDELGSPAGLRYGVDRRDLYVAPMQTLFEYQASLAERERPVSVWATGPVPLGRDQREHPAWLRYESVVNEALAPYPFHGLCTYDAATLPAATIAAAKASHPYVARPGGRVASREYVLPADFLAGALAAVPAAPEVEPTMMTILDSNADLVGARHLLRSSAATSLLPTRVVEDYVAAVNEVLVNGLVHGLSAVEVRLWIGPGSLVCEVSDEGPGIADPLSGFARPSGSAGAGLWLARRLCDEVIVSERAQGGAQVLLVATA